MMRAKFLVTEVKEFRNPDGSVVGEQVSFVAVGRQGQYPEDGSDEDNTFARWTPSANLTMYVANPALFGQLRNGDKVYADFSKVEI